MSPDNVTDGMALPENPVPIPEADIYAACKDFVLAYALPALDPDQVFQGWRQPLPAVTEEYAVISIVGSTQHGTTVETFSASDPDVTVPGTITIAALLKIAVRIDFCGGNDLSRLRAQRCAIVARSSVGVGFFNERGLSSLYADNVREHRFKDDARQFVRRYATVLHLSLWSGDRVDVPYFTQASLARLENVDVHHKVREF